MWFYELPFALRLALHCLAWAVILGSAFAVLYVAAGIYGALQRGRAIKRKFPDREEVRKRAEQYVSEIHERIKRNA